MKKVKVFLLRRWYMVGGAALVLAAAIFYVVSYPASVSTAASTRQLPIYSVERSQRVCAISFDAAWGEEKVRQFSRPKDGRSIIKGSKNHYIESKNGSIPLPNSSLFELHGNIFKPHPSRNPGQTSVVCITHGVLSFCIGQNTLYGLFSYVIELLATFDFSQFFDQIEIFLPDMSCAYPLPAFICATSSFVGTVFTDFGRTAVSPFPFSACGRMPRPIPHCR